MSLTLWFRNLAVKKQKFSATKEIRKLARERVGKVPAERIITPKADKKIKHKKLEQD